MVACGLEMPKPNQVKAYLEMASVESFKEVKEYEQEIYEVMVKKVRISFMILLYSRVDQLNDIVF